MELDTKQDARAPGAPVIGSSENRLIPEHLPICSLVLHCLRAIGQEPGANGVTSTMSNISNEFIVQAIFAFVQLTLLTTKY